MIEINSILLKINALIHDRNLTRAKLSRDLNINRGTLYNILDGKSDLTVEFIYGCANYFKLPVGYFITENNYGNDAVSVDTIFDVIKDIVKERIQEHKK